MLAAAQSVSQFVLGRQGSVSEQLALCEDSLQLHFSACHLHIHNIQINAFSPKAHQPAAEPSGESDFL